MIDKNLDISIEPLNSKAEFYGKNYIFICHASYEERSLSICQHYFEEGMIHTSILLSSEEYLDENIYSLNKKKLETFLKKNTKDVVTNIVALKNRPIANLKNIASSITNTNVSEPNFLIDISTFPRDRLICLLDYLLRIRTKKSRIEYIYTSPKNYGSEKNGGWLTRGVRKIEAVPRFNGKQKTRTETLLVMLLGHEGQRSLITLRNLEPDKLIIIAQGKLQANECAQKISFDCNESLLNESKHILSDQDIIKAPYSNPSKVDNILEKIWSEYSKKYNIIISVCGTKLQVLGALLTCLRHREIQIIYAYPQIYNIESYSENIGKKYKGEFIFKS